MNVLDLFVNKYPPGNDLRKPTAETLEQFQGKLPTELLGFWQKYGFGNYGGGLLKMIDPTDYVDTLTLWLGEQEDCFPILMTGFGTLFIYRKLSETADDILSNKWGVMLCQKECQTSGTQQSSRNRLLKQCAMKS